MPFTTNYAVGISHQAHGVSIWDSINRDVPSNSIVTTSHLEQDINANFVLDRGFSDVLKLPFNLEQIQVSPNELVTSETFNASLYKLYYNFLYLNSRCKLATADIPSKFEMVLAASMLPPLESQQSFTVNNFGTSKYLLNNLPNPTLTLVRGGTYIFRNRSSGFPFWISDQPRSGGYYHGVDNMGATGPDGVLTFKVPYDSPSRLYYYNPDNAGTLAGTFNVIDNYWPDFDAPPICVEAGDTTSVDPGQTVISYDQCPELNIPDKIIRSDTLSGAENLSWHKFYKTNNFCQKSYLSDIKASAVIDTQYVYGQFYLMFLATTDHLLIMEMDFDGNYSPAIQHYSNKVEDVPDLVFEDISSIAINSDNILYVADKRQNKIYQYTVENFTSNNIVMRDRGMILIKAIGGWGEVRDKKKFDNPIAVRIGPDKRVYILDYRLGGNYCIKVFDENLNWLETIVKKADFAKDNIVDMAIDPATNNIYVLGSSGKLFVYDHKPDRKLLKEHDLISDYVDDAYLGTRIFKSIVFSRDEKNVLYVVNDKDVSKKWTTTLDSKIGFFNWPRLGITDMTWNHMCLYQGTYAKNDTIFLYGIQQDFKDCGRIFKFLDQNSFVTLIYDEYKYYAYNFDQLKVKPGEFASSIVFNKSFLKAFYNHGLLVNNLHSTYGGLYDTEGNGYFTNLNYIANDKADIYNYQIDPVDLIGINEIVLSETVNRPLKMLFEHQESILTAIQPEYMNYFPLSAAPIFLR